MNLKEKVRDHFHKNEDLQMGLDSIAESLTGAPGTPEQKQMKLYQRIQTLAKAEDLSFDHCWNLFRSRHPELLKEEDLEPTGFAPKLVRRSEEKKLQAEHEKKIKEDELKKQQQVVKAMEPEHEKRMARIERIMASDDQVRFQEAWELTAIPEELALPLPTLTLDPPPPRPQTQVVMAKQDMPGAILIHGSDVGMLCPLFPPAEMEKIRRQRQKGS